MDDKTKIKLLETELHMKNYMDEENTEELRKMCSRCEKYCGAEHDYKDCREEWCYRFWLAYEYFEWTSSYDK